MQIFLQFFAKKKMTYRDDKPFLVVLPGLEPGFTA